MTLSRAPRRTGRHCPTVKAETSRCKIDPYQQPTTFLVQPDDAAEEGRLLMKSCPPPDGSLLPSGHRDFLLEVLGTLVANEFRQSRIEPLLPAIVGQFDQLCATDDEMELWTLELERWLRWYRLPAYWLTSIFQRATLARQSPWHIFACELFSDAQVLFADDLALASLETAYLTWHKNRATLGNAFQQIGTHWRASFVAISNTTTIGRVRFTTSMPIHAQTTSTTF